MIDRGVKPKIIYVYESFKSTTPNFLGTLFVENVRGRESYSFEYDADWLKSSANYMYLDPDLQLYAGRQYPAGAKMCSAFSLTLPLTAGAAC